MSVDETSDRIVAEAVGGFKDSRSGCCDPAIDKHLTVGADQDSNIAAGTLEDANIAA
jgi:hypothetical protein